MEKKKEVLKALGASVRLMHTRIVSNNTIEIGLLYYMSIQGSLINCSLDLEGLSKTLKWAEIFGQFKFS
jgi:hypothetical protein